MNFPTNDLYRQGNRIKFSDNDFLPHASRHTRIQKPLALRERGWGEGLKGCNGSNLFWCNRPAFIIVTWF